MELAITNISTTYLKNISGALPKNIKIECYKIPDKTVRYFFHLFGIKSVKQVADLI